MAKISKGRDWDGTMVTAHLWDVQWEFGGMGKHGHGPFATRKQAEACIRAVGLPGWPVHSLWTMPAYMHAQVVARAPKGSQGAQRPPVARMQQHTAAGS